MSESALRDISRERRLDQDRKRELDNRHKWALGEEETKGRAKPRPINRPYSAGARDVPRNTGVLSGRHTKGNRKAVLNTDEIVSSDSSAEDEVKDASAAPAPDADIAYSFDAPCGPSQGSQLLSVALQKAVEKYEIKATEKLVKDEYEIVGKEKDEVHKGYTADEDDYELV